MARHVKKTLGVGLALVAAAAGAGLALHGRASSAPATFAFACEPGSADVYRVAYESAGELSDMSFGLGQNDNAKGGPKAPTTKVTARAAGTMVATCVESSPAQHTVALDFEGLGGAFQVTNGDPRSAARILAGTTFVTRGSDGKVAAVRFAEGMPEEGRGIVREMLSLTQVTLPTEGALPATWKAKEEDANGPFEASYALDGPTESALTVTKARAGAVSGATAQGPHADAEKGSGGVFTLEPAAHRITSAKARVALTLGVGKRTVGTTKASLESTFVSARSVPSDRLASLVATYQGWEAKGAVPSDLAARDEDARLERRMQEQELGTDTWATLTARASDTKVERVKTFLKMKALFLLHPETCRAAGKSLVAMSDPNSQAFIVTAGALAAAGNEEAQDALVSATRGVEADLPRARALVASLGAVKAPTPATFDALTSLSEQSKEDELRGTARLALGSLARQAPDSVEAQRVVAKEIDVYGKATTRDAKTLALLTLGNTGADDVVAVARTAAASDDAQVRGAAMQALRGVGSAEAQDVLVSTGSRDEVPEVRAEALRSMLGRDLGPAATDVARQAARGDGDERVRMAAVQVLGADLAKDPSLAPVLERVAKADIATAVRNAAKLALERYRFAAR